MTESLKFTGKTSGELASQPHHFMYQTMCNSLICKRLYSLHINGDAQNDVQIYVLLLISSYSNGGSMRDEFSAA